MHTSLVGDLIYCVSLDGHVGSLSPWHLGLEFRVP